jgi:hypothetical protein
MKKKKNLMLGLSICAAVANGACATVRAKPPAERPPLEVPVPPGKVIEPLPHQEPAMPEPVGELPTTPPANPRPNRPPAAREAPRTDPKPDTPVVEPAPPPATPPAPAPQLRTPGTPDNAEAARQVRDILDRANKTLSSIDTRRFPKARQGQYQDAKRLVTQSEDALKAGNFDSARKLADKANDIAKELQGR